MKIVQAHFIQLATSYSQICDLVDNKQDQHRFDDNNFNIKPDGVHTGGNANSNLNDDDTKLLSIIAQYSKYISGQRIPVNTVSEITI